MFIINLCLSLICILFTKDGWEEAWFFNLGSVDIWSWILFLESRLLQCIVGRLAASQAALGASSRLSPTVWVPKMYLDITTGSLESGIARVESYSKCIVYIYKTEMLQYVVFKLLFMCSSAHSVIAKIAKWVRFLSLSPGRRRNDTGTHMVQHATQRVAVVFITVL